MNVLVLGGSGFIGKELLKKLKKNSIYNTTSANRTFISDVNFIKIDREIPVPRLEREFDIVIDLSCYKFNFIENTIPALIFKKYIFLSSMAVTHIFNLKEFYHDESPRDLLKYAKEKALAENYIVCNSFDYTIIRPGYVIGETDPQNRFEKKDNEYYWKKTGIKLTNFVFMDKLLDTIENSFSSNSRSIIPCIM